MLLSGFKAIGHETLRTASRILSVLADNTAGKVKSRHIIAKHVSYSEQNFIEKLRSRGLKRSATLKSRGLPLKKKAKNRKARTTKKDIFV